MVGDAIVRRPATRLRGLGRAARFLDFPFFGTKPTYRESHKQVAHTLTPHGVDCARLVRILSVAHSRTAEPRRVYWALWTQNLTKVSASLPR